jgi:cysteine synthase A
MNSISTAVQKKSASLTVDGGPTPLVALRFAIAGIPRRVRLKLEGKNPTGSSKFRTAKALMTDLEARRLLRQDSIVIESTSGNLGVALACICQSMGLRFVAIVDPKTTSENISKMRAFGAEIDVVTEADGSGGFLPARLKRLNDLRNISNRYVWTDQYSNWANPLAHYMQTGPEILRQSGGSLQAVYIPVSTGGTLAGTARYLRETSPATLIVGVDAAGSVVFGGKPGVRKLTGIGSSRRSDFLTSSHYDEFYIVSDREAFPFCRALLTQTGVELGGSGGAALAACVRHLEAHPELRDVTCICPDGGENYRSTIYSDEWLTANGFALDYAAVATMVAKQTPEQEADEAIPAQSAVGGSR